jgi:RNA polymerase sigma factor FliA
MVRGVEGTKGTLVVKYLGMVRRIAAQVQKDSPAPVEFEEFVSLGTAGLVEAAERFDPEVGVSFAAFAQLRVRGAMYDGLRKMSILPRKRYQALKRAAERGFQARDRGEEGADEGKERAPEGEDSVLPVYVTRIGALKLPDDELPDPAWVGADDLLSRRYLARQVQQIIETLPGPEKAIIHGCYFEGKTLAEVSEELGLSRSWTCRLHARALARLRQAVLGDE